ncbi:uncharacterized protein LY89DRAFT_716917 [Mollisia scopiformis]|uniref:Fungal N-terminal domain-containing protein n=1 Tax=Mollisia scopiformis TaxID=149040 RepID=A0A194XI09_MOLSC|nr:uncharacterized protein LY89DRAFT_716917 [Mollisia scopiformis]KUJ19402.1 hypothetical protein LY89DRAFT_716917 [Mollisia scopiformis]
MEAVAAVASIAGIIGLVGQALNGIIILRGFFQSCASESHAIQRFLKRLNDLIQIIEHARDLMIKLSSAPPKIVPESILASLQIQLDDCNKDVYGWLAIARECLPASNAGTKAAFKKFLVALERQKMTDIYMEISVHKDNTMTKLSVIGRCFDIDQSATLEALCERLKVWDGMEQSMQLVNGGKQETNSSIHETMSQAGSSSLASIAESLSRIENTIGDFIGPSKSRYGSPSASIGSLDSASVSGGRGRGWGSEPSQYSTSTSPRNRESVSSISERITQSLLDARSPLSESRYSAASQDGAPIANYYEAHQHSPQDGCLGVHYNQSTQMSRRGFIQETTKYIDLILLAEAIISKIKLFKSAPSFFFGLSDQILQAEIDSLEDQLCTIRSEATVLQIACWRRGLNTEDLDSHMAECRKSGSELPDMSGDVPAKERSGPAPAGKNLRLNTLKIDATRHDRINMWLLNNLEASKKEMRRHRSFLPNSVTLDKEQWARMVLKFWLLDEAAVGPEDECFSSIGAVDSDGLCHSERVLFEVENPT